MSIQEFGTEVGRVIRFFNRKGYGFIKNLNDDKDYFVHNSEIKCSEGLYRKLYPGEYVSFNLVEKDGKQVCSLVKGVMGYPLLIENEEHTFRVYPKQEHRSWSQQKNIVIQNQMMNLLGQVMILDLDQKKNQKKKNLLIKKHLKALK